MKVLAIIPARSGSKSIAHKNIKLLNGKPLMVYSIEHALKSTFINRVIVSTDSEYYAEIALKSGAEVPFLRPSEISLDSSTDLEFFQHALSWLKKNEDYLSDICVQLRPTHPVRKIEDIDTMINLLINDPEADSVRSVVENTNITPYKMWFMVENRCLKQLLDLPGSSEPFNMPRQLLPKTFFQNASVDVIRTSCILSKNSLSGSKILGYIMDEQFDIDYEEDFIKAEKHFARDEIKNFTGKKVCIDIDGVIATLTPDNDYSKASPINITIDLINELYEKNNLIILFTARGSETGKDWRSLTEIQMKTWGVKYHELKFGKPGADIFIDDRAINIKDLC
jgi:CMP-N-acetylneuraminic acid synthetase